jgi:hypothetical protein
MNPIDATAGQNNAPRDSRPDLPAARTPFMVLEAMEANVQFGGLNLNALVPSGDLISIRDEWLCEPAPSRRMQVRVAGSFLGAAQTFATAARTLSAKQEKWGPQRRFLRAQGAGESWVAVLVDHSTDTESVIETVVDFRTVSRDVAIDGARARAAGQTEFALFAALGSELSLPFLMTSIEVPSAGSVTGYIQFRIHEESWPRVLKWLETTGFTRAADDKWTRDGATRFEIFRSSDTIWASVV